MKKPTLQSLLLLSFVAAIVFPTASWGQSFSSGDAKECSQITEKDRAYVALADEFLLPDDVEYNIPSWRVNKVTPGIHWLENKIEHDEFVSHRIGWTDGHIRFAAFGPIAGIDWLTYRTSADASPVTERFKCSGYDLTPIEGPEGATAYKGHKDGKKDFFLIEDGDLEAVCVTSGPYIDSKYFHEHQMVADPHADQWCQFDGYRSVIERYTPTI